MKSSGNVRPIDNLGRIVIPSSVRRQMDIKSGDFLEILTDGDGIYLKKYYPTCVFCNEGRDTVTFSGKPVCRTCLREINKLQ